ncbi:MAG: Asp-tRNA(Asn)/Glu-tRNA(Gln) amidotransferase subunit GatC [Fusobacteriaceae bacterium]|nr:Asp-tRNA(Asn)/Glu-tRNA(Gln) amidotransferase subunit GatC [Fusobacteriaceae bacterium]
MALTKEEVLKIAKLSRLEFMDEEIVKFQEDLNNIFNYIDELNEVDTQSVEPLVQVNHMMNNFREDLVRPSLTQEEAMLNSPSKVDGMLIVPKVVGGEN